MPLLGPAAMLLLFDIAPEAIDEHDDWHTHEHLPERLAIPGFLRGTRWIATQGGPRYMVVYEVADLGVLTSAPYLDRLNAPSAWTSRMMAHYRGMRRGLCTVAASVGFGTGHLARLLRLGPDAGVDPATRRRLVDEVMPSLPATPGLGSAHLLESAAAAPMTHEQSLRGADAGVDRALLVTGYRPDALRHLALPLGRTGAPGVADSTYRLDYSLAGVERTR